MTGVAFFLAMRRRGRGLGIVGLIAFSAAAVTGLHRLGSLRWLQVDWADLEGWLRITPPENAAAAVLRILALVLAYWLLGSSAFYTVARLSRIPRLIRAAGWVTVPVVRQIVDRGIVVFLATSAVVVPPAAALAREPKPPPLVALSQDGTVLRPPGVEAPGNGTAVAGEGPKQHEGAPEPATIPTPGPPPSFPSPAPHQRPGPGSSDGVTDDVLPTLSGDAEPASPSTHESPSPSRDSRSHHTVVPGDICGTSPPLSSPL